jgi:hypothetical protein
MFMRSVIPNDGYLPGGCDTGGDWSFRVHRNPTLGLFLGFNSPKICVKLYEPDFSDGT